jgi:hypothetical protein
MKKVALSLMLLMSLVVAAHAVTTPQPVVLALPMPELAIVRPSPIPGLCRDRCISAFDCDGPVCGDCLHGRCVTTDQQLDVRIRP